jgi:hypothetical protein
MVQVANSCKSLARQNYNGVHLVDFVARDFPLGSFGEDRRIRITVAESAPDISCEAQKEG